MLHLRRRVALLGSDAERAYRCLLGRKARVYVASSRGVVYDQAPLSGVAPALRGSRAQLSVVLEGRYALYRGARLHELLPGDCVSEPVTRPERWEGERFAVLVVDWERVPGASAVASSPTLGRLTHVERLHLGRLAARVADAPLDAGSTRELALAVAAALGVAVPIEDEAWPAGAQDLADAVGATFSALAAQPQWIDLEQHLQLGERQLRRRLRELLTLFGIERDACSFRSYLQAVRIQHAASFLTARGATPEQVARSVGYGSTRAMGTALRRAGLPSPRQLAAAVLTGGPTSGPG